MARDRRLRRGCVGRDFPELQPFAEGLVVSLRGGRLDVLDKDAQTARFSQRERDDLGTPLVVGDDLYVGASKEALRLSLARCRFDGTSAVASLELAGQGCVKARFALPETAFARPARLGAAVYFLADGRVHQMIDDREGWVADADVDALLALERDGERLLLAGVRWTMEHPARVVALDPDSGKTLVQIDLPSSEMSIFDVVLGLDGDRLLAHTSRRLFTRDMAALVDLADRDRR